MIGFNHATVGTLIGKFLPLPIAIPVAFASHFILDSLPHFGIPSTSRDTSRFWKAIVAIDVLITLALLPYCLMGHHYGMLLCGIMAMAPDFIWIKKLLETRSYDMDHSSSRFTQWHADIQRYERPWGIFIEAPLAAILTMALLNHWL